MTEQISMIELFSGIGAQERALRQFGLPYEVKHTCDCDADAVLSYAAMRWDLEKEMETFDFPFQKQMVAELQAKNLGYDFQKGKHKITMRTPITKLKQYYIADKLSRNLGDISKVERLPYANLVTYSFPCTDVSVAGKGEGMANKCETCGHYWPIDFSSAEKSLICPECGATVESSTRSGLLGQVQRLLAKAYEDNELPDMLLMENVKNLTGKKFIGQFETWIAWLDSIGYNTYWKVLNGKHFGVPQNRERVFAISVRKDIDTKGFVFPETIPLTTRLKDVLEKNVDDKYYLPDDRIEKILNAAFMQEKMKTPLKTDPTTEEELTPIRIGGLYDDEEGRHQAGAIWDKNAISPTLDTMQGGNRQPYIVTEEPFIVASRGRNPENPSDRTVGAPTEQRLEPNFSGCTNTLTSVQKDNYVCEPIAEKNLWTETQKKMITEDGNIKRYINSDVVDEFNVGDCADISFPNGYNKANRVFDGYSPAINGTTTQSSFIVKEPIVYDDYNSRISADQDAINTLTCNCGASAERNGVKILEPVIVEDFYQSREPRVYSETAPTIRSERVGLKAADGEFEEVVERVKWRIRKLTAKECWRLMAFTDEDVDRAASYVAASSLYKQAGNSIITMCLIALMSSLFIEDGHKAEVWTKYALHFND